MMFWDPYYYNTNMEKCIYFVTFLIMPQAREKFLSLRKGTKSDVATLLEEVSFTIYS